MNARSSATQTHMMRTFLRRSWLVPLLMVVGCIAGDHRNGARQRTNLDGHLEYPDAGGGSPDLAEAPFDFARGGMFGCDGLLSCLSGFADGVCGQRCLSEAPPQ